MYIVISVSIKINLISYKISYSIYVSLSLKAIYFYFLIYLLAPLGVYLYTGSGTAGIKSVYESGIISRILW